VTNVVPNFRLRLIVSQRQGSFEAGVKKIVLTVVEEA